MKQGREKKSGLTGENSTPPRWPRGLAGDSATERSLSDPLKLVRFSLALLLLLLKMPLLSGPRRADDTSGESRRGLMALPSGVARTCTAWN